MAKRLKSVLSDFVGLNQTDLIDGRRIVNVMLACELAYNYHRKGISRRSVVTGDIMKAFNSVNWNFVLNIFKAKAPSRITS